jgi:leader peptidase (prepilin peptidase)/N-methyltransferase
MHMPVPVPAWALPVTAAVVGVAVGSYLTVLADRVLADGVLADRVLADGVLADGVLAEGVLADRVTGGVGVAHPSGLRGPAGRCPACGAAPRAAEAAPVAGWLPPVAGWLPPIAHWLLPADGWDLLVELGTGAGFAMMALRFGLSPVLPAFLLLAALAPALAVIDLRWRRLPDPLTLPAYPAAALLLAVGALAIPGGPRHFLSALAGMAAAWLFFALLAFVHPAGLGWGDVKLSGVLGLYLGWLGAAAVAAGLLGAFVLAALAGLGLIAAGRATRKSQIPFGPLMLASAIAVIAASGLAGSHFP